jgi:hypothetical protein
VTIYAVIGKRDAPLVGQDHDRDGHLEAEYVAGGIARCGKCGERLCGVYKSGHYEFARGWAITDGVAHLTANQHRRIPRGKLPITARCPECSSPVRLELERLNFSHLHLAERPVSTVPWK